MACVNYETLSCHLNRCSLSQKFWRYFIKILLCSDTSFILNVKKTMSCKTLYIYTGPASQLNTISSLIYFLVEHTSLTRIDPEAWNHRNLHVNSCMNWIQAGLSLQARKCVDCGQHGRHSIIGVFVISPSLGPTFTLAAARAIGCC